MEKYVVRNFSRPKDTIINDFKQLDVSTVYEAQGKRGLMNTRITPIQSGKLICGPAVTVVCYPGDNLMVHAAIEACKPGDVLVITTVEDSVSGMIGELIILSLMKRGVQGVIIDAGVRDVARIRELGFPVWSKTIHSQGTTKSRGGWVNSSAICGGTKVEPGDLIMADDDGVVVIEQNEALQSLEKSQKRMEKEESTKKKISNGEISLDYYNLRPTLEQEKVVYYDDISNLRSRP